MDDVATILSTMRDRLVKRRIITDDELEGRMMARGTPPGAVATTLSLYRAARAGEFRTVDPTLSEQLDRPPTALSDVLADWYTS